MNSMGTKSQSILSNLGIEKDRKISVYDPFMNFTDEELTQLVQSSSHKDNDYTRRIKSHNFFDRYATKQICQAVILLDEEDGLTNWDCCEADSLEECIDIIDGGFGIEQMVG